MPTLDRSARLFIGPAGLMRRNELNGRCFPVTGAGYDEENNHQYLIIQLFPPMPDLSRPLWKSKCYALLLGTAIIGLLLCLVKMGWLILTA